MMIGMASTFDPELVHLMADAIRVEMRAVGSLQGLAPVLDITRDLGARALRGDVR